MASQVVVLPSFLLAAIIHRPQIQHRFAFGARSMSTRIGRLANNAQTLHVEIDRFAFGPDTPGHLSDDLHAVVLTDSPDAADLVVPAPLPDTVTRRVLAAVQEALCELPGLTGHDQLQIVASVSQACQSRSIPYVVPRRTSIDTEETRRLIQAADLQAILLPALHRIDRRLKSYACDLRHHRLETAVIRLGLQADLGASLRLDPRHGPLVPRLATPHRRGNFRQLWQSTQNSLAAFQSCLDEVHAGDSDGGNWLHDSLQPVHSTLLHHLVKPDRLGRHRSALMQIRSPFDGAIHLPALPAERVPQACDAWARGYDSKLWRDLHPLLRAGMAHVELLAIHPFGDGNGRLGRLILQMMLIEDQVPGLPLEAIIKWNRHTYLERVDAAVRKADLLGFMQFLLKAVDKAIGLGRHFMRALMPSHDVLAEAFVDYGPRFTTIVSELAVSMLLGPDLQLARRAMIDPGDLCRLLQATDFEAVSAGGLDIAGYRTEAAWSSPVARDLLIAPPARL